MSPSRKQVLAGLFCAGSCVASIAREPQAGDLVAGFTASPAMGAPIAVEIDIGSASYYMDAAPGVYPVANLASDFMEAFGRWQTQRAISFGVAGTFGDDLWATSAEPAGSVSGTAAPAYLGDGPGSYVAASAAIGALYGLTNAAGAFGGGETRTLANIAAQPNPFTANAADSLTGILSLGGFSGSYSADVGADGEGFLIPTTAGVRLATVANVGAQSSSADLYELLPTTPLGDDQPRFGYFTLSGSGLLTYTAIPEPAAAAVTMALGAMAVVAMRRRPGAPARP